MRIISIVVLVEGVRPDRELVGSRLGDHPDHLLGVELALDECLGQVVQQGGIGRGIAGANIVQGFNDARAVQVAPEAIDIAAREVPIVRGRQPVSQLLATRSLRLAVVLDRVRKDRCGDRTRAFVLHLAGLFVTDDFVQRFTAFNRGFAQRLVAGCGVFLQVDLRKIRGHLVILVLGPALERMIVTLVAVEARGEEQVRGVFHAFLG